MDIETHINNYIQNKKTSFTFENIVSFLPEDHNTPERIIVDILEESPYLFTKDENKKIYLPKHVFFKGVNFLVTPTDEEIDEGILIPGHKFIPFYNEDLFPSESFDISDNDNEIICVKHKDFMIETLHKHYFLLGAEGIMDSFIAENPSNKELIGNPKNVISISVFDFKDFYKKNSFSSGDSILFNIINWNTGELKASILKESSIDEKELNTFSEHFESCLCKVFDKHGQWLDIPEQFSNAYLECDKKYLESPVTAITEFINSTNGIQIKFVENHTLLWHADKEEDKQENSDNFFKISTGTTESLDAILEECSKFRTSIEVEAFARDAIQNNITDLENITLRLFPTGKPAFSDKAQEASFSNFLEEMVEQLSDGFAALDEDIQKIHSNILNTLENFYVVYDNEIKVDESDYDLAEINQNIIFLRKILQHLNTENLQYSDNEEIEQLDNLVFTVLSKLNEELETVTEQ